MSGKEILTEIKKLSYDDQVALLLDYCNCICSDEKLELGLNKSVNGIKPTSDNKTPQVTYLKTLTQTAKKLTFPR